MFDMMQGFSSVTLVLIVVPFAVIALLFVWLAMRGRKGANRTKNWESVTGRILSADIEIRHDSDGSTTYPVITYSYRVMGKDYVGTRITPSRMLTGGSLYTPRVMERYPVDKTVPVYYNPENPQEAVLEQTSSSSAVFMLVAVIIAVSLICTLAMMLGMSGMMSGMLDPMLNSLGQ